MVHNMDEPTSKEKWEGFSKEELIKLLGEKEEIISNQEERIQSLQEEVSCIKSERDDLMKRVADITLTPSLDNR